MGYQEKKDDVWEKGSKIRGKDPDLYRKDKFGTLCKFVSVKLD